MTHPFLGPRGLPGYTRFVDIDGTRVELQLSSAAHVGSSAHGSFDGPFCWLRFYPTHPAAVGQDHTSVHLTPEMAGELIMALTEFLEHVEEDEEHSGDQAD